MKIDTTHLQGIRSTKGPSKATASEAFSGLMRTSSLQKSEGISSVKGPLSVAVMMVSSDKTSSSKKLFKRGEKILGHLSSLQKTLLGEKMTSETLQAMLEEIQSQSEQTDDEKLQSVMDEIELRLSVELAKLQSRSAPEEKSL